MMTSLLLAAAQAMTFTADRIAADNMTYAAVATGHVVAVQHPLTLRGEYMSRDANGVMLFKDPVYATTCTNEVGHTHWNVTGEIEYKENEYVILRNAWLQFYEVPVFWLPYLYYPLDCSDTGFSWMPGYMGRWGAFLLTKYSYRLLGDPEHRDNTWWLDGATRLDLRYRQGVAFGEDLTWNLGNFGSGLINFYYAYDNDVEDYGGAAISDYSDKYHSYNWGSPIERDRYAIAGKHRWEASERDTVNARFSVYSDSYFRSDFCRQTMFNWKSQWLGYDNSGIFWEHIENAAAIGAEVSGRLNDFYGMTGRLPEFYVDVNPLPVFGLPVNYETENRIGYLTRDAAVYGNGWADNPFSHVPGPWADYESFRFDTYHRLTAPFRTFDDLVSVVPRVGYHGTFWSEAGQDALTGWERSRDTGEMLRSILEGGITFAGRGTGWVDDKWRHLIEPYFDVLAQQAWYAGAGTGERPYVFDSIDASVMWEDQFAGRSRNLPYSYYGVTPGIRNGWQELGERGRLRDVLDVDVYAAVQFDKTSYVGDSDAHRLAEVGRPNYGRNGCLVVPGARVRWNPADDLSIMARAEYDSDENRVASADAGFKQKVTDTFNYYAKYALRDYRIWDFSSIPYSRDYMQSDDMNYAKFHYAQVGFEQQPLSWFAWGPYLRWDIRENELDGVGSWFDYLTDCLGFRLIVEYQNSYTRIDGYDRGDDWTVGFYIYLRAFGADSSNLFMN